MFTKKLTRLALWFAAILGGLALAQHALGGKPSVPPPPPPVQYNIVWLGTLPGDDESHCSGMNQNGDVVGWSALRGANPTAFLAVKDAATGIYQMIDLDAAIHQDTIAQLGVDPYAEVRYSYGREINNLV